MLRILRVTLLSLALPIALAAQRELRDTVAYTTAAIRLRAQPAMGASVVAALPTGTRVHVASCSTGWCSVAADSAAGYVPEEFLTLQAPHAAAAAGPGYINARGQWVPSPVRTANDSPPPGATARCRDGTYSFSQSRRGTCSHHGIAQIRVSLQEPDVVDPSGMGSRVAQDVEPVPDVHDVDQPILDDGITPNHDLVGAARQRRILCCHRVERCRGEEARLLGLRRVREVDRLQAA